MSADRAEMTDAETTQPDLPRWVPSDGRPDGPPVAGDGPPVASDGPLMAGADDLRARWQQVKAGFVDSPQACVAEAARIVEEAAEMLVAALRGRQQAIGDSPAANGASRDTEAMRVALLRYQSLFNEIAGE